MERNYSWLTCLYLTNTYDEPFGVYFAGEKLAIFTPLCIR